MKKISTIATVIFMTIFTTAIAKSASAACSITATSMTSFLQPVAPLPTSTLTGRGYVLVECNDTGKSLQLSLGAGSVLGNGAASVTFKPGTGLFTGNLGGNRRDIFGSTSPGGDRANFEVTISTSSGASNRLLKSGNYTLVIDATIVP